MVALSQNYAACPVPYSDISQSHAFITNHMPASTLVRV